jgi:Ig-like domain from next to BRCA1 gene
MFTPISNKFLKVVTLSVAFALFSFSKASLAQEVCNVPHFTVKATNLGDVSTKTADLNCVYRQRALAFFGKVALNQLGDADIARSGQWTSNGEKMAIEARDVAVKNSLIKTGIDTLVAKVKLNDKLSNGAAMKAVAQATLGFASKATVFASKLFCANFGSCSPNTEIAYSFTSETLKLASQLPSCLDGTIDKCADALKGSAKLYDLVQKYSNKPPVTTEIQQWAAFVANWLRGSVGIMKAVSTNNPAAYISASGDLISATINTYTGSYWRNDGDVPKGFDNLLEIIGSGTSTWLECKSAAMNIASLRAGEISAASAECVSKLNDYFNTRIAEIMSYSMVLFQASKEQYNALVIDGSRVVMGEVLRSGGWESTFKTYGIVSSESAIFAASKDLKIASAITAIAAKYGVSQTGLAALHSNWYDGWSGDIMRKINADYNPQLKTETDLIIGGRKDIKTYAGVKFDTVAVVAKNTVTILPLPTSSWDAAVPLGVQVKTTGANKGVSLQVLGASGSVISSNPMTPVSDNVDGTSDWFLDMAKVLGWTRLAEGSYSVRAVLVSSENQGVNSTVAPLAIKKVVSSPVAVLQPPMNTILSSAVNQTVNAGQPFTINGQASGPLGMRVRVVFVEPGTNRLVAENASFTGPSGPWGLTKTIGVADKYLYRVELDDNAGKVIGFATGQITVLAIVAPVTTPAPTNGIDAKRYLSQAPDDDIVVQGGSAGNKSWTIRNEGTTTWTNAYCLSPAVGPQPFGTGRVCVPSSVLPGATVTLTVPLTYPAARPTDTTFKQSWSFKNAAGLAMGLDLSAQVVVKGQAVTAPITAAPVAPVPPAPVVTLPVVGAPPPVNGLQPWQQASLAYVNNYLEGRQRWTECWTTDTGRQGTFCYRFARQAVGLPAMGTAIDAFENLIDQGRASTAGFDTAPLGSLIFYRIGTYGHVAVKVSATEVAGHGNELAFTATCPPITRVTHASLTARAPYAGFYAAGGGAVTLDSNVIGAAQRITRQDFLNQLKSRVRDSRLTDSFASPLSEPNRPITRSEAALLIGRALTQMPPALPQAPRGPIAFADATTGELKNMLDVLSSRDIVQGQSNELAGGVNFFGNRQLSRTESDALLSRSASLLSTKQGPTNTPPPPPPPTPPLPSNPITMNSVQVQGVANLGSIATFLFNGTNLTSDTRVTIANCEAPQTTLLSASQIRHQCTPRGSGAQPAGWKANAAEVSVRPLGTVMIGVNAAPGNPVLPPVVQPPAQPPAQPPVQTPPPPPPPPTPLTQSLRAASNVQAGSPWSAQLTTNVQVYQAQLVFAAINKTVPLVGGPTQWEVRAENAIFANDGRFYYVLQIRRTISSNWDNYPGGQLEVRPAPVVAITPTISSPPTTEQGKPYALTVRTSAPADRVTVVFADSSGEQGLTATSPDKLNWSFGNRLFANAGAMTYTIRTYKDSILAPVGTVQGSINVTAPAASLRLVGTSNNVRVGESPTFTVNASLSVRQVSVRLGNEGPVALASIGTSGAEQTFRANVPARLSGNVPYTIVGIDAGGQQVIATGSLAVAAAGSSLAGANPMPPEAFQGETKQMQFNVTPVGAQLWLEVFGAASGLPNRINLVGPTLTLQYTMPPGTYNYRLMGQDNLGNVYPITGAAGQFVVKVGQIQNAFTQAFATGPSAPAPQQITEGAVLRYKAADLILFTVKTAQPADTVAVGIDQLGYERPLGNPGAVDYSGKGIAGLKAGTYAAVLYNKNAAGQRTALPKPINFTIVVSP